MKKMKEKKLIIACMLWVFSGASAVNYNFDKTSVGSSSFTKENFELNQEVFGGVNYRQPVVSGNTMLLSQTPLTGAGTTLFSTSGSITRESLLTSSVGSTNSFYNIGSKSQGGLFESEIISPKGGPAKLPGGGGHEPWVPVGDGLLSLLLLAVSYAVVRGDKKEQK